MKSVGKTPDLCQRNPRNVARLKATDMPLTKKGQRIKRAMEQHYGKDKGEHVFYAAQNARSITGTHKRRRKR